MKEQYDGNKIRMVMGTRKGAWGWDPGFYDGGVGRHAGEVEGGCCVVQ